MSSQNFSREYYDPFVISGIDSRREQKTIALDTGALTLEAGTLLALNETTGKYVAYVKGDATAGDVSAVLQYDATLQAAGDVQATVIIKGNLLQNRLIILADGNANNIDQQVLLNMRKYGLHAQNQSQLCKHSNE